MSKNTPNNDWLGGITDYDDGMDSGEDIGSWFDNSMSESSSPASEPSFLGKAAGAIGKAAPLAKAALGFATGGVGSGLLTLVGQGLSYVLGKDDKRKAEAAADKRYKEGLAIQQAQFEKNFALAEERFGLTRKQYADQLARQKQLDALDREDRNGQKMMGIQQQFMGMVNNNNAMKDRVLQLTGLRR